MLSGEEVFQDARVGKKTVVWQTGKLARLADSACVCSIGGTQVLTTVVCERSKSLPTNMVPLQVCKILHLPFYYLMLFGLRIMCNAFAACVNDSWESKCCGHIPILLCGSILPESE